MQPTTRFWKMFDRSVLGILEAILALGIVAAVLMVVLLFIRRVPHAALQIENVAELQAAVQALFAAILLVILGLELMDTLRNYFIEHRMRVELLISVALIAVARHVIQLDYEHTEPWLVIAMAILILSLSISYIGVRALMKRDAPRQDSSQIPNT